MATKPRDYTWKIDENGMRLTKRWADNTENVFDLDDVPEATRTYFLFLGAKTAGANVHAEPMQFADKKRVTEEWWQRMLAGDLRAARGVTDEQLSEAVAAVTGVDHAEVVDIIAAAREADDQTKLRQLRSDPEVRAYLEETFGIKARKPRKRDLRSVLGA